MADAAGLGEVGLGDHQPGVAAVGSGFVAVEDVAPEAPGDGGLQGGDAADGPQPVVAGRQFRRSRPEGHGVRPLPAPETDDGEPGPAIAARHHAGLPKGALERLSLELSFRRGRAAGQEAFQARLAHGVERDGLPIWGADQDFGHGA